MKLFSFDTVHLTKNIIFLSFRFHLTVFTGVFAMTLFIIADGIV